MKTKSHDSGREHSKQTHLSGKNMGHSHFKEDIKKDERRNSEKQKDSRQPNQSEGTDKNRTGTDTMGKHQDTELSKKKKTEQESLVNQKQGRPQKMTETNKDESKWDSGEVEPVKEKDISSEDPGQKSKIRKKIHKSRPDENP